MCYRPAGRRPRRRRPAPVSRSRRRPAPVSRSPAVSVDNPTAMSSGRSVPVMANPLTSLVPRSDAEAAPVIVTCVRAAAVPGATATAVIGTTRGAIGVPVTAPVAGPTASAELPPGPLTTTCGVYATPAANPVMVHGLLVTVPVQPLVG